MDVDDNDIMDDRQLVLSSTYSTKVSLAGIRIGRYQLSAHRQSLLAKVPKCGDWASLERETLEMMDLAYLSAKTGDEFAILRGKHEDILFHGTKYECRFLGSLEEGLRKHKFKLIGHSHPGEDEPEPSLQDRVLLKEIGQRKSSVISARTGRISDFTADPFS